MNITQIISFANTHFFIGIDAHLKNWKVTIRMGGIELKTFSMNPSPLELLAYLQKHYPDGIYHIVYEAGFCGFWALRIFRQYNIDCIVVNPADVPTTNKEKVNKSDPIDSRKIARHLENKDLHGIYIPDIFHEELRALMRLLPKASLRELPYHSITNSNQEQNQRASLLSRNTNSSPVLWQRPMVPCVYHLA
jgi:predicted esterase YcpF (UPF0227 family)